MRCADPAHGRADGTHLVEKGDWLGAGEWGARGWGSRPERRRLRREGQCDERSTKSRWPSRRSLLLSGLPTSRGSGVPKLKQGGVTARVACAALGDPRLVLDGHVLGSIVHARGDGFIAECRWHGSGAGGGEASSPMRRVRVLSGENRIGGGSRGFRRGRRGRDARRFGRRKARRRRGLWRRGCATRDTPHRSKSRSSPRGPPPPNSASPTLPKTAVRQNWTGPRSSERGASSAAFRILGSCRNTGPQNGVGYEGAAVCGRGHQTDVHAKKGPPIGRFCRGSAGTAFSRCVESVQCKGGKLAPGGVGVWGWGGWRREFGSLGMA
jgi:hypothetical protein